MFYIMTEKSIKPLKWKMGYKEQEDMEESIQLHTSVHESQETQSMQ